MGQSVRHLLASLPLCLLLSCEATVRDDTTRAQAALAVATRTPLQAPTFVALGACPVDVSCGAADWNGDGQMDLIRQDEVGRFGRTGQLWVAIANGWGYAPFRAVAAGCGAGVTCLVADAVGSRLAELFRVERGVGRATMTRFSANDAVETLLISQGACGSSTAPCTLLRLDGARRPQLAWLERDALKTLDTETGKIAASALKIPAGSRLRFAEIDGIPGSDFAVLETSKSVQKGQVSFRDAKGAEQFRLAVDCSNGTCDLADVDGDGLSDLIQNTASATLFWASRGRYQKASRFVDGPHCKAGDRCFWADGNGDGFDDLYRIDAKGTLSFHPVLELGAQLEAVTLELSVLSTLQCVFRRDPISVPTAFDQRSEGKIRLHG